MKRLTATLLVLALLPAFGCEAKAAAPTAPPPATPIPGWPPRLNQPYPDLELIDQSGQPFRLSSLKGQVVLVEMVGMNCPACQAFSGASRVGSFQKIRPQPGLESTRELLDQRAHGLSFDDERFVFVQILLYSMSMQAPTAQDAHDWAEHFGLDRSRNRIVLAGTQALVNQASYDRIPGFQLIDRDFVLRVDATGHHPTQSLRDELMPRLAQLVGAP